MVSNCFQTKPARRDQYDGPAMNVSQLENVLKMGKRKKKISLVQKDTSPFQLFSYLKELLQVYPSHSFMARWQREQLDSLLENLPLGHVVCVNNYSEGYACRKQDETQS